jgi:import receptor subunit TOM22
VLERGLVVPQETVWERISALKDIIPPSTRQRIFARVSKASSYASVGLLVTGKVAWVVTTTALLVGLPYALAVEDEMRISQQERDMMSQQQGNPVSHMNPSS